MKLWKKMKEHPAYIKAGALALAAILFSGGLYLSDNRVRVRTNGDGQEVLERGAQGEDTVREMKLRVEGEEEEKDVEVSVAGREYTPEEMDQAFETAKKELEGLILGENQSLDEVRHDLDLVMEIPGSGITVGWELDRYDIMDIRGNLQEDALTEEGEEIRLTAILKCGEEQEIYEFYAKIFPPVLTEEEQFMNELQEAINRSDEKTRTEEYLVLPDHVDGQRIQWSYGSNTRSAAVLVLGLGGACMLLVSESQRKKEEEKVMIRRMKLDYPQIINKFNLYIRAGMTIRRAWYCIARDYEEKKDARNKKIVHKAYEEMVSAMYRINSGAPEGECYESFGTRCGLAAYRKFGSLLAQNLRKGSKGLTDLLGREAEDAFEERKNLAKKMGEEAGTKLMIPMFLMLIIVFAMVIVPAFFSIQM